MRVGSPWPNKTIYTKATPPTNTLLSSATDFACPSKYAITAYENKPINSECTAIKIPRSIIYYSMGKTGQRPAYTNKKGPYADRWSAGKGVSRPLVGGKRSFP
jgi:hypothetical protein